jgi:hypothetical protein
VRDLTVHDLERMDGNRIVGGEVPQHFERCANGRERIA